MAELFKTGLEELDELLRGGIRKGSAVIFWAKPGLEVNPFANQSLYHRLKDGDQGIYVCETKSPELVLEEFKRFGWNLSSFKKKNQFQFIDAYSSLFNATSEAAIQIKNPKNPSEITKSLEKALKENKGKHTLIVFDSLSTLLDWGGKKLLKEFLKWKKLLKKFKATALFPFTEWPYEKETLSQLMKQSDIVVELKALEEKVILNQYFSLGKPLGARKSIPFKIVAPGGVKVFIPKILVTGPFNAGKSSFIHSASTKAVSVDRIGTTIALDHGHVEYAGFSADLFGTPGQERFDPILSLLGGEALGVVVVIDSTEPESFDRAKDMLEKARVFGLPFVVAANKQNLKKALKPAQIKKLMGLPKDFNVIPVKAEKSVKQAPAKTFCPLDKKDVHKVFDALFEKIV